MIENGKSLIRLPLGAFLFDVIYLSPGMETAWGPPRLGRGASWSSYSACCHCSLVPDKRQKVYGWKMNKLIEPSKEQKKINSISKFETFSYLLCFSLLCLKVQSGVWGFNCARELDSIPKASANHPTAQHVWKIGTQVTDSSTDNATEEKFAPSFQPSGGLAPTSGWCVTFNWKDSGGRQRSRKEWSQWIDRRCLLPDGQPELVGVNTISFSGQRGPGLYYRARCRDLIRWGRLKGCKMMQFSKNIFKHWQYLDFLFDKLILKVNIKVIAHGKIKRCTTFGRLHDVIESVCRGRHSLAVSEHV